MPDICSRCGELTAPAAQDHLARRANLAILPTLAECDADAALALEQQARCHGVGLDPQIVRVRFASARKVCAVEPRKRPLRVICE